MGKKRILLFIKTPPPTTGATLMNQRVYESEQLRREFDIRSICISYMKSRKEMGRFQFKKIGIFVGVALKLIFELIFRRPDIVYFQLSPTGVAFYRDLIYISFIKLFRVKLLFHLHGKGIKSRAKKYKLDKTFYKFAFNNSAVICLSKLLVSDIEEVHLGETYYVPNGIPDIEFSGNEKLKIRNSVCVLFLSNLIEDKGVLDFLEALKIINAKDFSFKATIVGAEADIKISDLNSRIIENDLVEKVRYIGPKYGDEKNEVLSRNHILVFPTKLNHETFGIVNIEAMQHGLPVISTNISAIPDIIDDGITGFLVEPNSPSQIAEKLEILINNPEMRVHMGLKGRKKYEEKFTLEKFEENLSKVLKNAI